MKYKRLALEYAVISACIILMAVGVFFFKFPNHFSFGGVTGYSAIVGRLTSMSASRFTFIVNMLLVVLGYIILGRDFGIKTAYASVLFSLSLEIMEKYFRISQPLTGEPLLELVFAVFIPSVATAVLFNIGASSGGTDIIAMILKKYTSWNIGTLLLAVDILSVAVSFFVFGVETGLFSTLGLLAKSLVIDDVIESINMCKCFTIICDYPEPICEFIIHELHRSATVYDARGAFAHKEKTVVLATMKRAQAIKLRNFIRETEPQAFMVITSSSEIIGKGFLSN